MKWVILYLAVAIPVAIAVGKWLKEDDFQENGS